MQFKVQVWESYHIASGCYCIKNKPSKSIWTTTHHGHQMK